MTPDQNILGAADVAAAKALLMRKVTMFGGYAGGTCPACGGIKRKLHWLCIECRKAVGPDTTRPPELLALDAACKAHVEAAEQFVLAAQRVRGL